VIFIKGIPYCTNAYHINESVPKYTVLEKIYKKYTVSAKLFGRIKAKLKQQGLVTNNSNHFQRIPHLKLENWING